MIKTKLGRQYRFFAAHQLHNPNFTDTQNKRIYGKCNHPNGHGHTYHVTVIVDGIPDPQTSMICSLADLDQEVHAILEQLSHKFLDRDIEYFKAHTSTSERIVEFLYQHLQVTLRKHDINLNKIELSETRNNRFEIIASPN